jgi:hypothetical protein
MTDPAMDLAVSHDGRPEVHDRDRSSPMVAEARPPCSPRSAILSPTDHPFRVAMVVRPSNVARLGDGIAFLREGRRDVLRPRARPLDALVRGRRARRLQESVGGGGEAWAAALPVLAVNWFDDKAGRLAGVPISESARCGFGAGEIAVGSFRPAYPCERLIGEDLDDNPMRLPGTALEGADFLAVRSARRCARTRPARPCAMEAICSTTCRCKQLRTYGPRRPDGRAALPARTGLRAGKWGRVLKGRHAQLPALGAMEDGHGREARG